MPEVGVPCPGAATDGIARQSQDGFRSFGKDTGDGTVGDADLFKVDIDGFEGRPQCPHAVFSAALDGAVADVSAGRAFKQDADGRSADLKAFGLDVGRARRAGLYLDAADRFRMRAARADLEVAQDEAGIAIGFETDAGVHRLDGAVFHDQRAAGKKADAMRDGVYALNGNPAQAMTTSLIPAFRKV